MEGCGGDNEPSTDRVKSVSASLVARKGMVLIPAGEFQMGGHDREAEADELPVHTVYIDAFYMDKHANSEYKKFLAKPNWQKDWKG